MFESENVSTLCESTWISVDKMKMVFSFRTIFCSPELLFLEKKGFMVFQKSQGFAPPEHLSKK
jgi:hypothetical protein